jgi:hypothetical protein
MGRLGGSDRLDRFGAIGAEERSKDVPNSKERFGRCTNAIGQMSGEQLNKCAPKRPFTFQRRQNNSMRVAGSCRIQVSI